MDLIGRHIKLKKIEDKSIDHGLWTIDCLSIDGSVFIKLLLVVVVMFTIPNLASAQSSHTLLMDGDAFYEQGDYAIAEEKYRKATEEDNTLKGEFNLGNTLYNQNRYEEAVSQYETSVMKSKAGVQKSSAYYNLGNTHIKSGKLEEAIESYKKAIEENPADTDARRNLYLAKLMEQQQQEQEQQQQQEQNEDQENQDQEQNQDQQQEEQEQQNQDQENSQEQQEQSEESQVDNEPKEGEEEPQELSKEDAEKLLQVIENDEKKIQEKLRKVSGAKKKPEKDW